MQIDLIVVGGGAAGFFGAIQVAEMRPGFKVLILEKSNKLLSKVRISGGGRCNVTHHNYNPFALARHYPRGEKALKNLFRQFHAEHVVKWFASKGVPLIPENDGRMFPVTNSSETIIQCFLDQSQTLKIKIELGKGVASIDQTLGGFIVNCSDGGQYQSKKILIATGGNSKASFYDFIKNLHHTIKPPIPSLFTFNDSGKKFNDLMGISVPRSEVKIVGTKFLQRGPLLITHWGLSGPAIIKLSAWASEYLNGVHYEFTILVNWLGEFSEEELREILTEFKQLKPRQKIWANAIFTLPLRLSQRLCYLAGVAEEKTWSEISKKEINKLIESLIRCPFQIKGKTTFKEEFVTCGGVDLGEICLDTMESKKIKGIYFAGEVLDIDGETGGFNFQSAWTTAFIAARAIAGNA